MISNFTIDAVRKFYGSSRVKNSVKLSEIYTILVSDVRAITASRRSIEQPRAAWFSERPRGGELAGKPHGAENEAAIVVTCNVDIVTTDRRKFLQYVRLGHRAYHITKTRTEIVHTENREGDPFIMRIPYAVITTVRRIAMSVYAPHDCVTIFLFTGGERRTATRFYRRNSSKMWVRLWVAFWIFLFFQQFQNVLKDTCKQNSTSF